jgi:glycosyltransferase involved in cell wall biosynthesis
MLKISATIITLNEENYIGNCIKSLLGIASDVIVIDSGSSDDTVIIAQKLGAKVFFRKFTDYADQRNYASSKTKFNWVLSLDADEVLESELSQEISKLSNKPEFVAYSIPRKNIIFGKFIKYTRWQPELDRHIWLFNKKYAHFEGNVHEEIKTKGPVGKLKYAKVHYQYESVSDFLTMMNCYSSIEAKQKFKLGQRFSISDLIFNPFYNFLVRYFYRLGFLDGWRGLILSFLMAVYQIEVLTKIWEIQRKNV